MSKKTAKSISKETVKLVSKEEKQIIKEPIIEEPVIIQNNLWVFCCMAGKHSSFSSKENGGGYSG